MGTLLSSGHTVDHFQPEFHHRVRDKTQKVCKWSAFVPQPPRPQPRPRLLFMQGPVLIISSFLLVVVLRKLVNFVLAVRRIKYATIPVVQCLAED